MGNQGVEYENVLLGALYAPGQTLFRVWAPTADEVWLCLYETGEGGMPQKLCEMKRCTPDEVAAAGQHARSEDTAPGGIMRRASAAAGIWECQLNGDLDGVFYTYRVTEKGKTEESADPYARACGVNGIRSMVVNLSDTDPEGFLQDRGPHLASPTDAVICEVSVADISNDVTSGILHKGKFLGLFEHGTVADLPWGESAAHVKEGKEEYRQCTQKSGLDYLASLGVTHLQLMPIFDFGSVDEADNKTEQYNWGYDPVNYNVPEGSYATDPFDGKVRIRECKKMIQQIHEAGMGVVMDVVYNHTYDIDGSCLQKTAPDCFYRTIAKSGRKKRPVYSNASGCGNEIATERAMVRTYIIDSLVYWTKEYHVDGFRFDLMGVFDLETMQKISDVLRKIRPDILLYGEGWTAGESVLSVKKRAVKANINKLTGIGAFSDDIRDSVRGNVFIHDDPGFVAGKEGMEEAIRFAAAGGIRHPQLDVFTKKPWAKNPTDVINYISCHDNLTLWDKLSAASPQASRAELLAMNRLAAAIVFLSQGVPFFLSGEEFCRTKPDSVTGESCDNSYNMPRAVNNIRYDLAAQNRDLIGYYKGLIAFRKAHELLRLRTKEEVCRSLQFLEKLPKGAVGYTLTSENETILIAFNGAKTPAPIPLSLQKKWTIYITGELAGIKPLGQFNGCISVPPVSALVAVHVTLIQRSRRNPPPLSEA